LERAIETIDRRRHYLTINTAVIVVISPILYQVQGTYLLKQECPHCSYHFSYADAIVVNYSAQITSNDFVVSVF
jgi:hypothetical protein